MNKQVLWAAFLGLGFICSGMQLPDKDDGENEDAANLPEQMALELLNARKRLLKPYSFLTYESRTYPSNGFEQLIVQNDCGPIEIIGKNRNDIVLEIKKGATCSNDLNKLFFNVIRNKRTRVLKILNKSKKEWGTIHCRLLIPYKAFPGGCDINAAGRVDIDGVDGQLTIRSNNSVFAENINGSIQEVSARKNIVVKNITGSATINSRAGEILAMNVKKNVQVQTNGGTISLFNIAKAIEAFSNTGDICITQDAIQHNVSADNTQRRYSVESTTSD